MLSRIVSYSVERNNFHRDLVRATRRYQDLFNNVPVALFTANHDGVLKTANAACVKLISCQGIPLGKVNFLDLLFAPARRAHFLDLMSRQRMVEGWETEIQTCKGEKLHVLINTAPLYDGAQAFAGWEGCIADISMLKQTLEERDRLEDRIDHGPVEVVDADDSLHDPVVDRGEKGERADFARGRPAGRFRLDEERRPVHLVGDGGFPHQLRLLVHGLQGRLVGLPVTALKLARGKDGEQVLDHARDLRGNQIDGARGIVLPDPVLGDGDDEPVDRRADGLWGRGGAGPLRRCSQSVASARLDSGHSAGAGR
jgi:PAS domain S-box-containing protein